MRLLRFLHFDIQFDTNSIPIFEILQSLLFDFYLIFNKSNIITKVVYLTILNLTNHDLKTFAPNVTNNLNL